MEEELELINQVVNDTEENSQEKIIAELQDKILRIMAEQDNTRKRYEKQINDSKDYAIFNFAKDLIVVIDNCKRAIEYHVEDESDDKVSNIIEGTKIIHKELLTILEKNGIEVINPNPGEQFNYNLHHAISKEESNDIENNCIINLLQTGYKIKDRLLRPALVSVSYK